MKRINKYTSVPELSDHQHLIQKAIDAVTIEEKNRILHQALLLLDAILVHNLTYEKEKSAWPDYNMPGQCGLCGSFTCSGNCFK